VGELCDQCREHAEQWRDADLGDIGGIAERFRTLRERLGHNPAPKVERPCAYCGGEIPGGRSDRKYCTGACRVAAHRKQHRGQPLASECRPCEQCYEICLRGTRPDQRYCSAACKQVAYRERVMDREMAEFLRDFGPEIARRAAEIREGSGS
jgi:predicted nucleic acid-binding Zn ribbon protein